MWTYNLTKNTPSEDMPRGVRLLRKDDGVNESSLRDWNKSFTFHTISFWNKKISRAITSRAKHVSEWVEEAVGRDVVILSETVWNSITWFLYSKHRENHSKEHEFLRSPSCLITFACTKKNRISKLYRNNFRNFDAYKVQKFSEK